MGLEMSECGKSTNKNNKTKSQTWFIDDTHWKWMEGRLTVDVIPKSIELTIQNSKGITHNGWSRVKRKKRECEKLAWELMKWNEDKRFFFILYMIKIEHYVIWNENEIDFMKYTHIPRSFNFFLSLSLSCRSFFTPHSHNHKRIIWEIWKCQFSLSYDFSSHISTWMMRKKSSRRQENINATFFILQEYHFFMYKEI